MRPFAHPRRLLAVAALSAVGAAWAQSPQAEPSIEAMVEQLAPPTTTRSLRNLVPQPRHVDLQVHFDFDSAQLRADSLPLLAKLALTMQDARLERLRFRIEGHTDAKGGADYNDRLSARRAQAVAQHLIQAGVGGDRLEQVGKGSREPLLPQAPQAPENRRVRVVAIDQPTSN